MSDLQGRILSCALELYLEKGGAGLSMRQIAAKLNISATAIYRHYHSKQELLDRIVDQASGVLGEYLARALAGGTPEDRLRLYTEAYLDFALERSQFYEVMFLDPGATAAASPRVPAEPMPPVSANFRFLIDRVQDCLDGGYLKPDEAEKASLSLWAFHHGLISIYLSGKLGLDEPAFRKLFRESHERFLRGLRA